MAMLAVIGGTGLSSLNGFSDPQSVSMATPFADAEVQVEKFIVHGEPLVFIARHGAQHTTPPHKVNYRANIWALKELGVTGVIAINAVGGIDQKMAPGVFMIPDQLIDYTYGREHTFFTGGQEQVTHIDFTDPFAPPMRELIRQAGTRANTDLSTNRVLVDGGVYGVTQGPRLETAAEVKKLQRDGCDIVGMTAMPEAALARELALPYASLALSVNWAAGLTDKEISLDEIRVVVSEGMEYVIALIEQAVMLNARVGSTGGSN